MALLLIATYRSPVLWLVPLLVVAFADRVAASSRVSSASTTVALLATMAGAARCTARRRASRWPAWRRSYWR
ncbi:hypothetical protein MAHJHV35_48010 [Mycobacterium avium subsp. hominissuis]